jgi:hypothetical protein
MERNGMNTQIVQRDIDHLYTVVRKFVNGKCINNTHITTDDIVQEIVAATYQKWFDGQYIHLDWHYINLMRRITKYNRREKKSKMLKITSTDISQVSSSYKNRDEVIHQKSIIELIMCRCEEDSKRTRERKFTEPSLLIMAYIIGIALPAIAKIFSITESYVSYLIRKLAPELEYLTLLKIKYKRAAFQSTPTKAEISKLFNEYMETLLYD